MEVATRSRMPPLRPASPVPCSGLRRHTFRGQVVEVVPRRWRPPGVRRIAGRPFVEASRTPFRAWAVARAEKLRERGYYARLVKSGFWGDYRVLRSVHRRPEGS